MTDSASSFRNSPLSMRMHEACVPTAWANKAATTAESTPPERPQITLPSRRGRGSPRCFRGRNRPASTCRAAAHQAEKIAENLRPQRRVRHLGMKLQAEDRQLAVLYRGERARVRRRQGHEIVGDGRHLVAVAHPHLDLLRQPGQQLALAEQAAIAPGRTPAPARSRPGPRGPRTPTASHSRCPARGCRDGRFPDRTSGPGLVDARRPAGENQSPGANSRIRWAVMSWRTISQ